MGKKMDSGEAPDISTKEGLKDFIQDTQQELSAKNKGDDICPSCQEMVIEKVGWYRSIITNKLICCNNCADKPLLEAETGQGDV